MARIAHADRALTRDHDHEATLHATLPQGSPASAGAVSRHEALTQAGATALFLLIFA